MAMGIMNDRSRQIIRTSWIGIISNMLLACFKAVVGTLSNSIAIVMDAINNLSDALSSIITIIGTKLTQRPADRKHPLVMDVSSISVLSSLPSLYCQQVLLLC